MLSSTFLYGGANALRNTDRLAVRAEPVASRIVPAVERAVPMPVDLTTRQLVQINGAVQLVFGAMLATGKAPRLSALVLTTSLIPTTVAGHRFWEESDPLARANSRTHLLKNVSVMGGLLVTSVDTEGRPSLAWRARRQAGKAAKQAAKARRQAAKSTRRQRS
jgi:putative oxidoreductase